MASLASGKTLQLSRKLSPGDTTLYANVDIGVTSGRLFFQSTDTVEWVSFSGVAATGSGDYAYSNLVRQLSQTADPVVSTGSGYSWLATTEAELVYMHDQMIDKNLATQSRQEALTFATTAARDAALGGNGVCTHNYTDIKVTATGLFYNYNTTTAQWEVQGTGTATPNMSQVNAGSAQEATLVQAKAGTKTGSAADLVITPDILAQVIQEGDWIYASATGTDTYAATVTPAISALTTGMQFRINFANANTGAATLNVSGLGAKNIKNFFGLDPTAGELNGIVDMRYDGTNFVSLAPLTVVDFGDGSDGDVTINGGTTTLTRDMFYNNLTITSPGILDPNGYRVFVKGTLSGNGTIRRNGNNGGNSPGAGSGTAGTAGAALNTGNLGNNYAGTAGGTGVQNYATPGNSTTGQTITDTFKTVASNCKGGNGGNSGGGAGGTGGNNVLTKGYLADKSIYINAKYVPLGFTPQIKYNGLGGGIGGGSGGAGSGGWSAGGGGGGSSGGIILIIAKNYNFSGTVSAIGGNGGSAGTSTANSSNSGTTGGSGGGAGGSGGIFYCIAQTFTNGGTITLTGGNGGTGAAAAVNTPLTTVDGGGGGAGGDGGIAIIQARTITLGTITYAGGTGAAGGAGANGGSTGATGATGNSGTTISITI